MNKIEGLSDFAPDVTATAAATRNSFAASIAAGWSVSSWGGAGPNSRGEEEKEGGGSLPKPRIRKRAKTLLVPCKHRARREMSRPGQNLSTRLTRLFAGFQSWSIGSCDGDGNAPIRWQCTCGNPIRNSCSAVPRSVQSWRLQPAGELHPLTLQLNMSCKSPVTQHTQAVNQLRCRLFVL